MNLPRRLSKRTALSVGTAMALSVCMASSSFAASNQGAISKQYAGQTITVLVPPWGQMPASSLKQFTNQTGIKVKLQVMSWDGIHDKIVTSEAAHIPIADVTEVDWSWVGQFAQTNWYTPLNSYISAEAVKDSAVANVFTVGGNLYAMPYSLDYRVTVLNMTEFKKAGITKVPTTWAQLLSDAKQIKAKGIVQYPLAVPMSVTEGSSTPWYLLIKSAGGELFDKNWNPLFTSPSSAGAQALEFEKTIYDQKLVPPGETTLTDLQNGTLFQSGRAAILLASSPGGLPASLDPKQSKVAHDDIQMIATPGTDGHRTGTFGLPEGLGIPTLSQHKGAAAMFINWWMQTPQLITAYENPNMGVLPPESYALQALNKAHKLIDGTQILSTSSTIKPLFPQGAPSWYPQFSNAVATMIQSVVQGKQQPSQALQALASQAQSMRKGP